MEYTWEGYEEINNYDNMECLQQMVYAHNNYYIMNLRTTQLQIYKEPMNNNYNSFTKDCIKIHISG